MIPRHASSDFEIKMIGLGNTWIAGTDEVGRGAFAGPVVTGVVVFSSDFYTNWSILRDTLPFRITDSKKLKPKEREVAAAWISQNCLQCAVGEASVREINRVGIVKATNMAFRKAIQKIEGEIDQLLIDAFFIPRVRGIAKKHQVPLIKGDARSVSIAAASIIAKVYRDQLMEKLGRQQPFLPYLWHKNKGYGTLEHREALVQFGATKHHRVQFISKCLGKEPLK